MKKRATVSLSCAIRWAPIVGTLLCFSAVGPNLVLDDYVIALAARREPLLRGLSQTRWDLFAFTSGERVANQRLIEQGLLLPWWSDPELKVAFYRPLSSLSHRLDEALWQNAPKWMYVHSLAWLALTLYLAARCYRCFESSPVLAGVASVLYAVDDARGSVVAWISNRNALIATAFGLLALLAHDRWRRAGQRTGALLGPAYFSCALLGGELGLSTLGYLIAHALFVDRAPTTKRVQALAPYAGVVIGWMVLYSSSGAGVRGSGTYLSPLLAPARFARAFPERALVLLGAAFGPVSADFSLFGRPQQAPLRLAAAAIVIWLSAYALWPALRRDAIARFWLCGMSLAVFPVVAAPPSDRLLSFIGIGAAGVIARIVQPLLDSELRSRTCRSRQLLALPFAALHALLAPLLLPLRAGEMQVLGRAQENASRSLDGVEHLEQCTVVIVNAPIDLLASYIQAERAWKHRPLPKHFYWLTSTGSAAHVKREDAHTLLVERENGFLSTPLEIHYRSLAKPLERGAVSEFSEMTARVRSVTVDGRPLAVSFRFAQELESNSYVFLSWKGDRYERLAVGELHPSSLELPAEDFGDILMHTLLGAAR